MADIGVNGARCAAGLVGAELSRSARRQAIKSMIGLGYNGLIIGSTILPALIHGAIVVLYLRLM